MKSPGSSSTIDHGCSVNCGVLNRQVVFRTSRDSTLGRLANGSNVTFECDDTDPLAESGWSVVVRGRLWAVVDPDEVARLADSDLRVAREGPVDEDRPVRSPVAPERHRDPPARRPRPLDATGLRTLVPGGSPPRT